MIQEGSQEGKLHNSVNFERPRGLVSTQPSHPQKSPPTPASSAPIESVWRSEWLASGWILELARDRATDTAAAGETDSRADFLIGGGTRAPLTFEQLEQVSQAVWTPDFFPGETVQAPFGSAWTREISREELLSWLSPNPETLTVIPSSKISWEPPQKKNFERAFARIQAAFREDGVKKAVPVVFSTGIAATSNRLDWLANRLRAGILATTLNDLRLYGAWSDAGGFVGATPEALFTQSEREVSSMAVAGTRAMSALGDKAGNADALATFTREFLADAKERNEHELVVRDIESVFSFLGLHVEKSATDVERFGALLHLVTHLKARAGESTLGTRALVEALHPTPALGVSPRDSTFKLLREVHDLCGEGVAREGFGAPFVVKYGERVEAVVAIRQLRWVFDETDRVAITVGSGCGIVPESNSDREWNELASKRRAVMKMFRVSTESSEPVFWSLEILERLLAFGVRRFVVCAGARNAPLVVAAEALRKAASQLEGSDANSITVQSFFEERSAAFYALGLSRSSSRPVAVLTTSGTAVAELLPAMVEADFSGVPLIAVTADRPRRLRLSGAPQSIPQDDMMVHFAERVWDLEEGDEFAGLDQLSRLRPIHVNICLEEPLLSDAEAAPDRLLKRSTEIVSSLAERTISSVVAEASSDHALAYAALGAMLSKRRAGQGMIAIVGGLDASERDAVAEFIKSHAIPCLLEGPSGLRGDARLSKLELCGGDRDLQRWCTSGELASVLRIGGVPTTRVWRDLDEAKVKTQTLSISRLRFSGLARGQFIHLPGVGELAGFLKKASGVIENVEAAPVEREWLSQDRATSEKLASALKTFSHSEPSLVRALSEMVSSDALLYVGNSLPIRWWDMAATRSGALVVEANRGVNGIDGQLSTALGLSAGRETWILVGDLTALYDLTAPWALAEDEAVSPQGSAASSPKGKVRIVVLNNSGGRIFKRVLAKAPGGAAPFENQHQLQFKNWAQMWNLGYAEARTAEELKTASATLPARAVIELIPSADETAKFWTEL